MDKKEFVGGLPDFIRELARKKLNSGCAACQAEGRAMMQQAADMEGSTHVDNTEPPPSTKE